MTTAVTKPVLKLWVDGQEQVAAVSPSKMLLDYLRVSGHVAVKEGCAEGDCGACTVAVRGEGTFKAINSCLVPLAAVAGQEVVTAAGLAKNGMLHPVQKALAEAGGSQCGFCTPGFVMSLFAAGYSGETGDTVLEGNLCRCTGYRPIREAARSLAGVSVDDSFHTSGDAPYQPESYSLATNTIFALHHLKRCFLYLLLIPKQNSSLGERTSGLNSTNSDGAIRCCLRSSTSLNSGSLQRQTLSLSWGVP